MIGHIGCGYWGKNIANTLHRHELLSAIYDFDNSINKEFSEKFDLKLVTFEEILNNKNIVACSVATPAKTHFSISKDILESGKHLFVEKPICLSLEEAEELKAIADDKSLKIMVGHLLHYHAGFIKLKELIKLGDLGCIKKIKSYRKSYGILRDDEDVIWSFAPHDISLALSLTAQSPISNLSVLRKKFFNDNTDAANIFFDSNQISIEIDVDWTSSFKQQRFEIYAEEGILILDDTKPENEKLALIKLPFNEAQLKSKNQTSMNYIECDYSLSPLDAEILEFHKLINEQVAGCYNDASEAIQVLKVLKEIDAHG